MRIAKLENQVSNMLHKVYIHKFCIALYITNSFCELWNHDRHLGCMGQIAAAV